MSDIEDVIDALSDHNDAQDGVMLAQTSLFTALITMLRETQVITQAQVNIVLDSAITGAEMANVQPAVADRARKILELIAGELQGPPKKSV
jgi:hypothetical protein